MSASTFRKKPIEVQALQWLGGNLKDMLAFTGSGNFLIIHPEDRTADPDATAELYVNANSRWLPIADGEWVIKDHHGFYPCKADVFEATYYFVSAP